MTSRKPPYLEMETISKQRDGNGLTSGEAGRNEYIVVANVERHMGGMQ
jgi:hypothetical protein